MEDKVQEFIETIGKNRVKRDEPMSLHTTFKVGGPAQIYFEAEKVDDLVLAIKTAMKLGLPYMVFGQGSNMLVSDKGILGVVIRNKSKNIKVSGMRGKMVAGAREVEDMYVEADAGIAVNYLVRFTIEESLAGLEVFLGLPGTIGGAIWNNSHFRQYNDEFIGNLVYKAKLLDKGGMIKEVDKSYFRFGYDYSVLQDTGEIVLSVIFQLKPGNKDELWQIASNESVHKRREEQPLELPSSGCTFQNISKADALRLGTPNFTQSAGYLIDQAHLKGTKQGGAMISNKHANFIVNTGGATADDIRNLMIVAKQAVKEKFSVELKEEIKIIGQWES